MRKGFYFSFDSIMALIVMVGAFALVSQISENASTDFTTDTTQYRDISIIARDAVNLASVEDLNSLDSSLVNYLEPSVDDEAMNRSVLNGISLLWAKGNRTAAANLSRRYFDSKIPDRYEYAVYFRGARNAGRVYNTSRMEGSPRIVTVASTLVSGHRVNRSSSGYRARALIRSYEKNRTDRTFIGGYVGQGMITYNISLENVDRIRNFTMKMDVTSPFDLYVNGQEAMTGASFQPRTGSNLTVERYLVCSTENRTSLCQGLESGSNNVTFIFSSGNRSIRGGVIRTEYSTTSFVGGTGPNYIRKKRLPGIYGTINYYDSFYVPGDLNEMAANLHYRVDNRTVFLRSAGTELYSRRLDGEGRIRLTSSEIRQELQDAGLGFDDIENVTVPLRIGVGNISGEEGTRSAIADSVSVMDVSGSMQGDRLAQAKNASKLFVDIILKADGNRAGFVSYSDTVVDTHPLTRNGTSLRQMIESQTANGNTCIGCGILEATDVLTAGTPVLNTVPRGGQWSYNTSFRDSEPPGDWASPGYDDSSWNTGSARFTGTDLGQFNGSVYFRREFTLNHSFYDPFIWLNTNGAADVYLNGELVYNGTNYHQGLYWNREFSFSGSPLQKGTNVLAVRLKNRENDTERLRINSEQGWNGFFSDTTVSESRLQLLPQFDSGVNVDATNYTQISGDTSRGGFFGGYETYIDAVSFSNAQNQVEFTPIDHSSGNNGGYLDATDRRSEPLIPGKKYRINVTLHPGTGLFSNPTAYATVAFDWNGNSILDENVTEIGSCNSNPCTVSTVLKVPEGAENGSTIMRVMGQEGGYHTDPQSSDSLTEVEDYSVFIDSPAYGNGSYFQQVDAGETVNWTDANIIGELPGGTGVQLNFSTGGETYDTINQVPDSQTVNVTAFLRTYTKKDTPRIEQISVGYPVAASNASFDASLNLTERRKRSMVVMSDGAPNVETSMTNVPNHYDGDGWFFDPIGPVDHAIEAACRAQENHRITVYTVGFGDANDEIMRRIAECGGGKYYPANTSNLASVFRKISNKILQSSYVGQTKTGNRTRRTVLYPDSYLSFNYTDPEGLEFGKIKLRRNAGTFGGQVESPQQATFTIPNGTAFRVPEGTEVESATATSYSGNRWTYTVQVNGSGTFKTVFNLSDYGSNFQALGDPFDVNIPEDQIKVGVNAVRMNTITGEGELAGGSPANRVFYTLQIPNSVGYGDLFPTAEAAREDARRRLNNSLDFDGDGQPIIEIDSDDYEYSNQVLGDEPYLWGPANLRLVVWDE